MKHQVKINLTDEQFDIVMSALIYAGESMADEQIDKVKLAQLTEELSQPTPGRWLRVAI